MPATARRARREHQRPPAPAPDLRDGRPRRARLRRRLARGDRPPACEPTTSRPRSPGRARSRARRGLREIEWWLGWSATPRDAREQLLELGLVPDDVPTLTGMTCSVAPPEVADVEVRRVETAAEYLADGRDRLGGLAAERGRARRRARRSSSTAWEPVDARRRRAPLRGVRRRQAGRLRPRDRHGGGGRAVRRRGAAGGAGTRRLPGARPGALGARGRARHAAPRRAGGSHVRPRS